MISLNAAPAFGFETETYNAQDYYYQEAVITSKKNLEISIKRGWIKPGQVNGDFQALADAGYKEHAKTAWKTANVVKVLGYIPLVGSFIGLARILGSAFSTPDEVPNRYHHIARGCVELSSLGILLLIPDLFMTGYRAFSDENTKQLA